MRNETGTARTFYRIVKSDPPTMADFLSDEAKGKPRPKAPERAHLHQGLSVYATLHQARRKARGIPVLGRYVAELQVPDDASVKVE